MIQTVRYDQPEPDNTAYPQPIFLGGYEVSTGRWQNAPHRIAVGELMERMSASGYGSPIRLDPIPGVHPIVATLQSQLAELADLGDDWNGYGAEAPNESALSAADGVLNILNELDLLPSRIVASADGGVSLVFLIPDGYVDIECFNKGEILVGFQLPGRPPEIEEVALDKEYLSDLIERIRQLRHA